MSWKEEVEAVFRRMSGICISQDYPDIIYLTKDEVKALIDTALHRFGWNQRLAILEYAAQELGYVFKKQRFSRDYKQVSGYVFTIQRRHVDFSF